MTMLMGRGLWRGTGVLVDVGRLVCHFHLPFFRLLWVLPFTGLVGVCVSPCRSTCAHLFPLRERFQCLGYWVALALTIRRDIHNVTAGNRCLRNNPKITHRLPVAGNFPRPTMTSRHPKRPLKRLRRSSSVPSISCRFHGAYWPPKPIAGPHNSPPSKCHPLDPLLAHSAHSASATASPCSQCSA